MVRRSVKDPARVRALRELEILDTAPEQEYDDLVLLAAAICRTPVAILNLVDEDRQWGKALVGQDSSEAPLDVSFCSRTILADDGLLVVPDTRLDVRFAENPLVVADEPPLIFYAGSAVETADGHRLGSMCVVDHVPRELDASQVEALEALARQAAAQLDLRRRGKELAAVNDELRRLALRDPLTGLANRTLVLDRLETSLLRDARAGTTTAVVFCDLDGLKRINDTEGHARGDLVLREVAAGLRAAARATDTVARLGGDEFVVLCEGLADLADVPPIVARLRAAVPHPMSVGVAVGRRGASGAMLITEADRAMYVEKGRSRHARTERPASSFLPRAS